MIWQIGATLKFLFLPPLGLIWLVVLAGLLLRRRPRTARWLLGIHIAALYLCATPWFAGLLMEQFVNDGRPSAAGPGQAIVVLGGGRLLQFGSDGKVVAAFPGTATLERLLSAAQLQRATGVPLLVTGGALDPWRPTEAEVMQDFMQRDFHVPVRWSEARSRNTMENAAFSAPMLREAGVQTIYLVTHAYHMRRARILFEAQGFKVIPFAANTPLAALGPGLQSGARPFIWRALLPNTSALHETFLACNELVGWAYARIVVGSGA